LSLPLLYSSLSLFCLYVYYSSCVFLSPVCMSITLPASFSLLFVCLLLFLCLSLSCLSVRPLPFPPLFVCLLLLRCFPLFYLSHLSPSLSPAIIHHLYTSLSCLSITLPVSFSCYPSSSLYVSTLPASFSCQYVPFFFVSFSISCASVFLSSSPNVSQKLTQDRQTNSKTQYASTTYDRIRPFQLRFIY